MAAKDDDSKFASHPAYPEMILSAIADLEEREGSSESAISKHIETTYGHSLPDGHSAALAEALAKMKDKGELLLVKNNYLKAGADATPRRGRGRPAKPKTPLPPGSVLPTPRPRGRPPKPKDPLAAAVAKASSGLPRSRGRPPKKHRPAVVAAPSSASKASKTSKPTKASKVAGLSPAGVKRGRGRPPKV